MNTSHGLTGLNSYHLKTIVGEYLYDTDGDLYGSDRSLAHSWLWEPECLVDGVSRVAEKTKRHLIAERAR